MKKILIVSVIVLLVSACNYSAKFVDSKEIGGEIAISSLTEGEQKMNVNYTISEPVSEGGLQVFKITGKEELKEKKYTSLSAALKNKLVVVKETGSVNELSIDNNSDAYVFIHSGDIVKGGQQDRAIAHDIIVPPKTKEIPLQSFCVEQGRWQQRENENVQAFESNTKMLSSKKLKLAARYDKSQQKVWNNVAEQQKELNSGVSKINGYNADITSEVSKSSLQLSLESEELKKAKKNMENKFQSLMENDTNIIGYAYAINGEIMGVDIYNNKELFNEIWPKIKESIMTEAISKYSEDSVSYASVADVNGFIGDIKLASPKLKKEKVNKHTELEITENKQGNVLFSTIDTEEDQWLHINFMKKENDNEEPKHENSFIE